MNITGEGEEETTVGLIAIYGILGIFFSIYVMGVLLEIMTSVLFFYHIIIKKTKYFMTGFFYILTIGFGFDLVSFLLTILTSCFQNSTVQGLGYVLSWYSTVILGPWNTLMALNRFTAVCFWKKHDLIWCWKTVVAGLFAMFAYPFIISLPQLIENGYCMFHPLDESCGYVGAKASLISTVSNGIHVVTAAILGLITAYSSRCNLISVTPETKKFEQFLLRQSIISLAFYFAHLAYFLTTDGKDESLIENAGALLSETYYTYFRISSILLLFFLSKTVRQSFISFYFCKCCCSKMMRVGDSSTKVQPSIATKTGAPTMYGQN